MALHEPNIGVHKRRKKKRMGILDRFSDIIKANVNALLDKMEDPAKMIDQYLIEMSEEEHCRRHGGGDKDEAASRRQ